MIAKKIKFTITAFFIFIQLYAQDLINSGPMVGYSTMQEVLLWVQTSENAKVHFEYYEIDNPSIRFKTDEKITEKKTGFVAKLIADQVMPGKKYNYEIVPVYIKRRENIKFDLKIEKPIKLEKDLSIEKITLDLNYMVVCIWQELTIFSY